MIFQVCSSCIHLDIQSKDGFFSTEYLKPGESGFIIFIAGSYDLIKTAFLG